MRTKDKHVTTYIINTFEILTENRRKAVLLLSGPGVNQQPIAMKLEQGKLRRFGRDFKDQQNLINPVSRNHYVIDLSDKNRIIVENHNSTDKKSGRD